MATDPPPSIGALVRRYRRAAGLTQEALAERAQVSAPTVSALERGISQLPHPDTLDRIAEALQIAPADRAALQDARRRHLAQSADAQPAEDQGTIRPLAPATNVLPALTSFVGRVREEQTVRQLLRETRLLTLTGPGGCGKTRLALHVVGALLEDYPDGVWLVELATVTSPQLVPDAVATALGIAEEPGRQVTATLCDFLASRRLLLLLDNCEHLVAACAELASTLLHACPQLRILATSRESLEVAGETIYLVPSLEVPDPWRVAPPEELRGYAAVRLFEERARVRRTDFALSMRNAAAVVQICHQLDGIPLAIELAAARIDALPAEEIAARLDDCFRLLTGGPRMALPRQKTLRATLDWSFSLLTKVEQDFLPRLSVFAGGWTLEAAEAVGADEGVAAHDVLDLLASLVRKSLVLLDDRSGGARYRLLDTVRHYGQEVLVASGTAAAVQRRFRGWCLALAAQAEAGIEGPELATWLNRIEADLDNLRSLMARGVRDGEAAEEALRLATALRWFWPLSMHVEEGRWWLDALLASGHAMAAGVRAVAIYANGRLADMTGDHERAQALYPLCLPLFRELGDTNHLAYTLHWLSWHAYRHGDSPRGAALREESLRLFRESGDRQGFAVLLSVLGNEAHEQSDYPKAVAYWEEAETLFRDLGASWNLAMLVLSLGEVALVRGDLARAEDHYTEGLSLLQGLGQPDGIVACHFYLGEVALARGEGARAADWFQQGLALCQEMDHLINNEHIPAGLQGLGNAARLQGDFRQAVAWLEASMARIREVSVPGPARSYMPRALSDLGHALLGAGDPEQALALYRESLELLGVAGYKPHIIRNLEGVAGVAATQGRPERGAQLLAAAASAREAIGAPLPPSERAAHERTMAAMRASLGADAFEAAWAAGWTRGLEAAVTDALATASAGP